jgi:hypothetical protein
LWNLAENCSTNVTSLGHQADKKIYTILESSKRDEPTNLKKNNQRIDDTFPSNPDPSAFEYITEEPAANQIAYDFLYDPLNLNYGLTSNVDCLEIGAECLVNYLSSNGEEFSDIEKQFYMGDNQKNCNEFGGFMTDFSQTYQLKDFDKSLNQSNNHVCYLINLIFSFF